MSDAPHDRDRGASSEVPIWEEVRQYQCTACALIRVRWFADVTNCVVRAAAPQSTDMTDRADLTLIGMAADVGSREEALCLPFRLDLNVRLAIRALAADEGTHVRLAPFGTGE